MNQIFEMLRNIKAIGRMRDQELYYIIRKFKLKNNNDVNNKNLDSFLLDII